MNKKECNIVRDLLPNYTEDLLNADSIQLVENHISNCIECKEILEMLQYDKKEQDTKLNEKEEIEINRLKKYRKKMFLIKTFLFVLIAIIIVMLIISVANVLKSVYIHNIKISTYNSIQKLKEVNNYCIYEMSHYIDTNYNTEFYWYSTSCYKDGKLKETNKSIDKDNNIGRSYSNYCEIGSNKRIEIDNISKTITNATYNYNFKNSYFSNLTANTNIYPSDKFNLFIGIYLNYKTSIKTEKHNNIECFVITDGNSNEYNKVWIAKDTMLPIRRINVSANNYYESILSVSTNELTDKDFEIPQLENYTTLNVDYNMTDNYLKFYNLY
ncbi:MAG: zf-HC2 domain-containing protein [Clostridia bacterium]|nr:zf-HC2 domain-containing protein [Clostridia bacterium]